MRVTDNAQNTVHYLFVFCYFPFSHFLGQFVGHFCTEQKVIVTTLFQVNSYYVQKVWQTTPLQKFYVDAFLIKITFSIFSSIFTCIYIYASYFVFILVIELKLKYNKVFKPCQHLVTLELFLVEMESLSYCMIYTSW